MSKEISAGTQIYASICANLLSLTYGVSIGWISTSLPLLKNNNDILPTGQLTINEISIIGGAHGAGGFFASCMYGWIADKIGRKLSLISLGIPQILSWLLILFAPNSYFIMASRFLSGFSGGGVYIVVPHFISEIAEDRIRGTLGALFMLSVNTGILIAYTSGSVIDYHLNVICLLMFPIIFLIGIIFVHESPIFLLKKGYYQKSENALKFYRGLNGNTEDCANQLKAEYDKMLSLIKTENQNPCRDTVKVQDFMTKAAIKSINIGICLMIFEIFTGGYALLSYASMVFDQAGSTLSPNTSTIIIGGIQIIGTLVSVLMVDRAGRKFLMMTSAIGCTLGLLTFGTFDLLSVQNNDVSKFRWLPLASFSFVIFFANIGLISLPFLILTEVTPMNIKSIVYAFDLSFSWLLAFLTVSLLPLSIHFLSIYGTMYIFAGSCLFAVIFIFFYVPETTNKSMDDIQIIMSR